MSLDQKVLTKFDGLISDLNTALAPTGLLHNEYKESINGAEAQRIRTEALNVIRRIHGQNSDHYQAASATDVHNDYRAGVSLLGVIVAAKNDYEQGFIFNLKSLVEAEVLGDFSEQAEFLLRAGYFHPAASLLGAVLEDALRKLSDRHGIAYPDATKLEALNVGLAKAGIYDKLIQKRITALGDIRNNADHGKFDKFKSDDVEDMLSYIRRFMADFLG